MKPRLPISLPSASPATCFTILGSCVFIGFFQLGPNPNVTCCGIQSTQAQVTVHVATSILLSRQHPCRDIDRLSRHQSMPLQISVDPLVMSRHHGLVVTSILVPCILHLVVPDVATSGCCRDMGSSLLHSFTGCLDVATSAFLSRHQLLILYH